MKVFLNYSAADAPLANALARELHKRGVNILRPEREVHPGERIMEVSRQTIRSANAMVVLLSSQALNSTSVRKELTHALGSKRYQQRVVPVLIGKPKGVPWILREMELDHFGGDVSALADRIFETLSTQKSRTTRAL